MLFDKCSQSTGRWKEVLGNYCKHKVTNKYEKCSRGSGRSMEFTPDPIVRVNE